MAANKQQGRWFLGFLVGLTLACAGIAGFSSVLGKAAVLVGIVILAASFGRFFRIKPLEGRIANGLQPAAMKLAGVAVTVLGWLVVLLGLHLTSSVGGRLTATIVGLIISLVGMCGLLPVACNKNAIWKG